MDTKLELFNFSEYVRECMRSLMQLKYKTLKYRLEIQKKEDLLKTAHATIEEKNKEIERMKASMNKSEKEVIITQKETIITTEAKLESQKSIVQEFEFDAENNKP